MYLINVIGRHDVFRPSGHLQYRVEVTGIEPATFGLQSRRSPS